jgi:hypothetical protein
VALSGSCSNGDSSPSGYLFGSEGASLAITSSAPGDCHVALTFATGFTYSTDITFVSQTELQTSGCPACPSYTAPTQAKFSVANPSATCAGDASPDDD